MSGGKGQLFHESAIVILCNLWERKGKRKYDSIFQSHETCYCLLIIHLLIWRTMYSNRGNVLIHQGEMAILVFLLNFWFRGRWWFRFHKIEWNRILATFFCIRIQWSWINRKKLTTMILCHDIFITWLVLLHSLDKYDTS